MTVSKTVIVKLAERCNLACPYCYMYNGPDQSWRSRPRRLGSALVPVLVARAAELVREDNNVHLILEFHGGEPLLFGWQRFAELMSRLHSVLPAERVTYCLQTNGTLLNEDWCDLLSANRVFWSISIDGPLEVHDRFRFRSNGKGSHAEVEAAIRLSQSRAEWHRWFGGTLAVVDPSADGGAIVRYFHKLGLRHLDFLMPDATHAQPPAHLPDFSEDRLLTFMLGAFQAWAELDDPNFHIRSFEHIGASILGRPPQLDALGGGLNWLTVIETDGSYQLLDVLHTCGEEFTQTGGSLETRSFAEQFSWQERHEIAACATCKNCPVFDICGGGYLPHRFDGAGFDNPSVHCRTLYGLIEKIHAFLGANLPPEAWVPASVVDRSLWSAAESKEIA